MAQALREHGDAIVPREARLRDMRFRVLLGAQGWARLPAAVQARFSKRYAPGRSVSYAGTICECRMTRAGWLLAQVCRLIGSPLPLDRVGGLAAVVTVTEHGPSRGQVWTRVYARPHSFPQVIHSAKMFSGPTGLEEYLGLGIGIALRVEALADRLRFVSDHYFIRLGSWRMRLPRWAMPGRLTIDHIDRGHGRFDFVLDLAHPLLGEVIYQHGAFHDQ